MSDRPQVDNPRIEPSPETKSGLTPKEDTKLHKDSQLIIVSGDDRPIIHGADYYSEIKTDHWHHSSAVVIDGLGLSIIDPRYIEKSETNIQILISEEHGTDLYAGYLPHTVAAMAAIISIKDEIIGSTFVDYGSGNGILSILALKLGASKVILYENNPRSIAICKKYLDDNNIDPTRYQIIEDDLSNAENYKDVLGTADIGIANIGPWTDYGDAYIQAINATKLSPMMKKYISGGAPFYRYNRLPQDSANWNDFHSRERLPDVVTSQLEKGGFKIEAHLDCVHSNTDTCSRVFVCSPKK